MGPSMDTRRGSHESCPVKLWTRGSAKPFGKKDGEGIRPITLFETVLKLATGLALDVSKKDIINAVGDFNTAPL